MSILNLNGTTRKPAKPVVGEIFQAGLASLQHGTVRIFGRSYNSPFTASNKSVFPSGRSIATQPALQAIKLESAGTVVLLRDFTKIHPNEKGSVLTPSPRMIVSRTGGPSRDHDTAASPNAHQVTTARPVRRQPLLAPEKNTHLSFLRSGGTLSVNANKDSFVSRWHTVKKGAVE